MKKAILLLILSSPVHAFRPVITQILIKSAAFITGFGAMINHKNILEQSSTSVKK